MKDIQILDGLPRSTRINKRKVNRLIQSTKYPDTRIYDFNTWACYINEQIIINSFNHSGRV